MKLKYYLRGLGTGIIFAVIVMLVALNTVGKISNEEIMEKAERLGMVKEEDIGKDNPQLSTNQAINDKNQNTTNQAINQNTTNQAVNNPTDVTTKQAADNQGNNSTKQSINNPTDVNNQNKSNSSNVNKNNPKVVTTITVLSGMTSQQLASKLEQADLVDDKLAFDRYLVKNGYANRIRLGVYKVNSGLSYKELALLFTK